eukprot:TRINITY_DN1900_c0_g1_i1.p1 TRINITY_DN1900_c0_g1~~TRINITY_DN1900_c0_g1_i1.p1  ORF type:complete len:138 (-),score=35.27 TRINITY_DN1900_c0_g1_i1:859-1272(-)
MTMETPSKAYPKVVKLEKAMNLAESWVNNMSGSTTDESTGVEFQGRPSRLGLGAKIIPQLKVAASADPAGRKLHAKLDAEKRRAAKNLEDSSPPKRNNGHDESDDDDSEDPESRTNAFVKKRAKFLATSLQAKKKQK